MDVIPANILALLGLDVLDRESLIADTVANRLIKRATCADEDGIDFYYDEWHVPLFRSHRNHAYAKMDCSTSIRFTRGQLLKLHKQFFHPSAEKLFNLLRKSHLEETTPETFATLQEISRRCDPCQRIQNAPTRFRVSFGAENVGFNERILLDIVTIDSKPVLHIIDEGTRFSAARFLSDVSTNTIWSTIMECWSAIYAGLPNRILVDQGSNFGNLLVHLAAASNVEVQHTGIEAQSSLGLGERYHQPLRQTYRKLMCENPKADSRLVLAMSVKTMNDKLGPEGLVPSALVFREFPREYTHSETPTSRPNLQERALMAHLARKEMEKHMADMRVKRALKHKTPVAVDKFYQPGDQVLVWRENIINHRIVEWLRPFTVMATNEEKKLVCVRDAKIGAARPFNIVQVKRYIAPEIIAETFITNLGEAFHRFGEKGHNESSTFMTEILHPCDPRSYSPEMTAAKKARNPGPTRPRNL